jgi:SAM-dependent methyltransferase
MRLLCRLWPADDPHVSEERRLLDAAITGGQRVLDAGCGRTTRLDAYRGRIAHLVGVDLDATAGAQNATLDEFVAADLCLRLPFDDAVFDVVYANFVIEHLAAPAAAFAEWHRVLRPGGQVVLLAANANNPVMLGARLLPESLRRRIKRAGAGTRERDVFQAWYRANTPARLTRMMSRAGFTLVELRCVGTLHRYARRPTLRVLLAGVEALLPARLRSTMVCSYRA